MGRSARHGTLGRRWVLPLGIILMVSWVSFFDVSGGLRRIWHLSCASDSAHPNSS